jgi:ubiquinone/menaquinone biosynthesis C-methylase UbiE
MHTEPRFAGDLYHGTAEFYDRFRLAYPKVLIEDLLSRVQPSGRGRLLDLACGTGQLAYALQESFAATWAVDQEPDMVRVVAAKAARGGHTVRAITSSAEELLVDSASFELITIGNAFHRLRRDVVARRAFEWLRAGGHLALCWSNSPWTGDADWQQTLSAFLDEWRSKLNARDRIPRDWQAARQAKPDLAILADAGFEPMGRYEFRMEHHWTPNDLAGFVYATSFLAGPLFGDRAAAFEADLANHLEPHLHGGALVDQVSFAYDLVRKPSSVLSR